MTMANDKDNRVSEIEIARKAAGITQQQLADMLGIPIDTVRSWGCGRRRPDRLKEKLILEKLRSISDEYEEEKN